MAHGRVVCLQRPLRVIPRNACGPRSFAILLGSLEQRRAALEDPRRETMSFVTNALYGSLCKHLTGNKTNQKIERKKTKYVALPWHPSPIWQIAEEFRTFPRWTGIAGAMERWSISKCSGGRARINTKGNESHRKKRSTRQRSTNHQPTGNRILLQDRPLRILLLLDPFRVGTATSFSEPKFRLFDFVVLVPFLLLLQILVQDRWFGIL